MFFYSHLLQSNFKSYFFLTAFLSVVLGAAQPNLAQEQTTQGEIDDWVTDTMCATGNRLVNLEQSPSFTFTQSDGNNPRHLNATQAGLSTEDLSNLELAWAVAFPGTSGLRAAPVIIGSTIFYSATDSGRVFALDTNSGCAKWVYEAESRLRSSLAYSEIDDLRVLVFSDSGGMVHAIDAKTGEPIWIVNGQASNNQGMLTGTPVIHEDKIIVPVSGSGVITGGNPNYECCENHGAVTALNVHTGEKLWEYHTMPAAEYTGQVSSTGVKQRGPSGAPIWTTPTIDAERSQVYVTTGENTSHPTTNTSDAIIALDIETGEANWVFQALENDMWNFGCSARGPNCIILDDTNSVDFDFGGPAILVGTDEKDLLVAGQKSGDLWALDPETGELVWNQRVGEGTALGGNHWGIATDSERAFMTINDPRGMNGNSRPGIYSYFVGTGEPSWFYEVQPECNDQRSERIRRCESLYGFSATPLSVDGAVITGGLDGRLFVFNSDSGELIFQYDTAKDYETVNGVEGYGGSIDSHSIAAGSGMVFVGSGYGQFRQVPGNVLLAFKPAE
ncbi:MAG TPA: PQQ-binding-like beta-propeller repeat protein [Gammaproteobacteria bacterium]|jgi:polyvinyl alcohol dehydrogenase (cytochrome)|nr:PQQ-binding-like beta-propeller repeat protein [Gammaproteobacteria bacterium]|tara:strand:- start:775 stop:2454 length:1680 start_codon:yes stop_codon:yes gene_type:complete